jgi:formylglycine-generating enzyme required for sulfatase activity
MQRLAHMIHLNGRYCATQMKSRACIVGLVAFVLLGLMNLETCASEMPGALRLNGTFIQYQDELETWGPQMWLNVLAKMKEVRMDTVIVQMLVRENNDGTTHSFIGPSTWSDATETILRYGDTNGFKVYLGLYLPSWNHDMTASNFLAQTQAKMAETAQQAWDRYLGPTRPHPSFSGWYIPYEPWTGDYQPGEVERLRSFFRGIHDACRLVSGDMPMAISPFISSLRPPPCRVEQLYEKILDQSGINILLLQDSVGAQQWDTNILERVAPYFQAFQGACQAKGVQLWANLESFQISGGAFGPCDVARLRKQFDAAAPFVGTFVTFDFLHYMNPVSFLSTWDQARRSRMQQLYSDYEAAFVKTDYVPYARPEISSSLETAGINLRWRGLAGDRFEVLCSTNLVSAWTPLETQIFANSADYSAVDTFPAAASNKFYRVQRMPRLVVPESMVRIDPGTFMMGTPTNDTQKSPNELPQFQASFTHGFWISRTEVTQSQYQNLMCTNPAGFKGDLERPVETVSWFDAMDYCARLTLQERESDRLPEGYSYRLPTEAEWEYAARAGATNTFTFGDDAGLLSGYGWYNGNSQSTTHPVGLLRANDWGLHDTCGNVLEWCLDWISPAPSQPVTDIKGSSTGLYRAVRGGAWCFSSSLCRPSWRIGYAPGVHYSDVGFRVVLASSSP